MSIMGYFLSTAQKHNSQNFEHNRLGPNYSKRHEEPSSELFMIYKMNK